MEDLSRKFPRPAMLLGLALQLMTIFLPLQLSMADDYESFSKSSFPSGFAFGAGGSAYQIEGGAQDGGRGPSIWDTFTHVPGKIEDGSNGDVAADSYHRYKEDVKLLKEMGMDSYRFSISWSRLLPQGTISGGISQDGVQYYHNLINEALKHDIKPFATLFHWDLPQALEDKYKGFLDRQIVKDFTDYADFCFKEYGDKVKQWVTVNEPLTYASQGYDSGANAPGRCSKYVGDCTEGNSATEPYIVGHNLILAHASAVRLYKNKYQKSHKGTIGITINTHWMVPYTSNTTDRKAAQRALDFSYGWFMTPVIEGHYPKVMRIMVKSRLPKFSEEEREVVRGSYDFIGLNYYSARYVSDISYSSNLALSEYNTDSRANLTVERDGVPIGQKAASSWLYIYPQGLRDLLLYTKKRYRNPPVYITENGVDEENKKSWSLEEALNDTMRINFYSGHLKAVREGIIAGADVRGFFAWSILDNFEWSSGYTVRFGLYYVDFNNGTLDRYPKKSVGWFKDFLQVDSTASSSVAFQ